MIFPSDITARIRNNWGKQRHVAIKKVERPRLPQPSQLPTNDVSLTSGGE